MAEYQGHIVITKYLKQHFLSIEVILDKESITDKDSFIRLRYNFSKIVRKILDDHLYREEPKYNKFIVEFYTFQAEMSTWYIQHSLNKIGEALECANIDINPDVLLYETNASTH